MNDLEIWMWWLVLSINHPAMCDHSQQKKNSPALHLLDSEEWLGCVDISLKARF
jgi:hypothetical protein